MALSESRTRDFLEEPASFVNEPFLIWTSHVVYQLVKSQIHE